MCISYPTDVLVSVLQVCDDAIEKTFDVLDTTSSFTDAGFEAAKLKLKLYELKFYDE